MNDTRIHVLLIEDNPGDARLIEFMLAEAQGLTFDVAWEDNLTAGFERIRTQRVDVVLLDLGLPESSGLATLQLLFSQAPRVPTLVVLSGLSDETVAFQAVQRGAQDYLVKGQVDSALLVRSIRYAMERSQAEEALRLAHAELERRVAERTVELANAVQALHAEIAERERAERALQERDVRIRRLVESNIIGIFFWDIEGGIIDANDAFLQIVGYSKNDLMSSKVIWKNLTPPEYRGADERAVDELKTAGTCTPYEKEYIRKDGSRVPILIGGALVEKSLHNGVAFVLDVSARRQADAERHARQIAEAASQAKSEFLANMSHELRSPLNTILGFARLAARQPGLPQDLRDDMHIILRSGEHLHALINQVLDLSKIEAGRISLNEMSFDLDQLLDEMEDMFSIKACDKGLQLLVTRDQQVAPYIRSDQIKLRQVLINLLNNALKFTKKGSVTLHVKHGPAGAGASHLQFTVTDTGVGIAEDELDRLFDAFIQAKAGQQAQEGTGLGLAISRSFVRLMGGELYIRSRIGEGTTVSFEIPVQLADANSLASPIGKPMRRVAALAPGQPRYRILVADDRKEARQLIARLLRPVGFELREASNGQEALDIWREWHPQLILMDMRMPLLNGSDTTRMIRATGAGKDTIIIALTASGFEEERTEILTSGCDDFLSKPFEESALFALMQKHLGVSFLFQEEVPSGPPPAAPIETVSLSTLPPRLLASLERSLILLDTAAIKKAVADIRAEDTRLADALTKLTEDFQYDRILQALQEAESNEEERT